jgi:heme/copper-type cytochrome/quinol oxidase subunit 2
MGYLTSDGKGKSIYESTLITTRDVIDVLAREWWQYLIGIVVFVILSAVFLRYTRSRKGEAWFQGGKDTTAGASWWFIGVYGLSVLGMYALQILAQLLAAAAPNTFTGIGT